LARPKGLNKTFKVRVNSFRTEASLQKKEGNTLS